MVMNSPASYLLDPAMDAEEFLARYNNGQTNFCNANLAGMTLTGADLI